MSGFNVNFHQLEAKMKEMERKAEKEFAKNILQPVAEIVADGIKDSIVDEDLILTGKLKESIGVHSPSGSGTRSKVKVGISKGTDQEVFRYGMTHNYGSPKKLFPATHFLDKGFQRTKNKAQQKIEEGIKRELNL